MFGGDPLQELGAGRGVLHARRGDPPGATFLCEDIASPVAWLLLERSCVASPRLAEGDAGYFDNRLVRCETPAASSTPP